MPSVLKSASLQITRSCWQGIDAQITQIKSPKSKPALSGGEASKGSKRLTSPTPNAAQGAHGSYKINQKPGYIHNLCDPPVFAPSTTSMFILLLRLTDVEIFSIYANIYSFEHFSLCQNTQIFFLIDISTLALIDADWCQLMMIDADWCYLVAKFISIASGSIWWSNFHLMQMAPSGGQICIQFKWYHVVAKFSPVTESIPGSVVPLAMFI